MRPSLELLIKSLMAFQFKQASIGQCILKAMRPNSVIPPLLFGLGVVVDHVIGSKTLLTELPKLGYSISYDEAQCYKQSLMSSDTDLLTLISTEFAQFVSDNVDHNLCTLDGSGTFHVMGIIVCSTNVTKSPEWKIQKLTKIVKSKEVAKKGSIHLSWYDEIEDKSLGKLQLVSMEKLK